MTDYKKGGKMKKGLVTKKTKKHKKVTLVDSLEINKGKFNLANNVYKREIYKKLGESSAAHTILPQLEAITTEFIILQTGLKKVYTEYMSGAILAESPNFMLHAWQKMDSTLLKYFIGEIGGILLNQDINFKLPDMVVRDKNGMIKTALSLKTWKANPRESDKFVIKKIGEPIRSRQIVVFERINHSNPVPLVISKKYPVRKVLILKATERKKRYLTREDMNCL